MLKILRDKPVLRKTWRSVTFFYEGERITWYFWRFGKERFHWETGYEDDMWYRSFAELKRKIEDFEAALSNW